MHRLGLPIPWPTIILIIAFVTLVGIVIWEIATDEDLFPDPEEPYPWEEE